MRSERRGMAGTLRTHTVSDSICFLAQTPALRSGGHSILAAIGPHTHTDVQWNVTMYGSYGYATERLHAPKPRPSVWRDLRVPIPRCLTQVVAV